MINLNILTAVETYWGGDALAKSINNSFAELLSPAIHLLMILIALNIGFKVIFYLLSAGSSSSAASTSSTESRQIRTSASSQTDNKLFYDLSLAIKSKELIDNRKGVTPSPFSGEISHKVNKVHRLVEKVQKSDREFSDKYKVNKTKIKQFIKILNHPKTIESTERAAALLPYLDLILDNLYNEAKGILDDIEVEKQMQFKNKTDFF